MNQFVFHMQNLSVINEGAEEALPKSSLTRTRPTRLLTGFLMHHHPDHPHSAMTLRKDDRTGLGFVLNLELYCIVTVLASAGDTTEYFAKKCDDAKRYYCAVGDCDFSGRTMMLIWNWKERRCNPLNGFNLQWTKGINFLEKHRIIYHRKLLRFFSPSSFFFWPTTICWDIQPSSHLMEGWDTERILRTTFQWSTKALRKTRILWLKIIDY